MTIHSSLKVSSGSGGSRNVWSRMERIVALKKQGKWQEGQKVTGLPKVRTRFKAKAAKKKEEPAAGAAPAAAAPAAAGAPAKK